MGANAANRERDVNEHTTSKDDTRIGYYKIGSGPLLASQSGSWVD
jgi:hypothetical protein